MRAPLNLRFAFASILTSALILGGCTCGQKGTISSEGEVYWQWLEADGGAMYGSSAAANFPLTDMGSMREMTLTIQNVGSGAFTMKEFVKLSGSPTFLSNPGDADPAVFTVQWDRDAIVYPTETTTVKVTFRPPVTDDMPYAEYAAETELQPSAAETSALSLAGRGLAPDCYVPELIDFGSILLNESRDATMTLRNLNLKTVTATSGSVTGAPPNVFTVTGFNEDGTLPVPSGASPQARVVFRPTQPGEFVGQMTLQRADICPQRTVKYRGRGVERCLSWRATPPGDPAGRSLDFGGVGMGEIGKGSIDFINACSIDVTITGLEPNNGFFTLGDVTLAGPKLVPAAKIVNDAWVDGHITRTLEFRPTQLGRVSAHLLCDTTLPGQSRFTIDLKGTGVGARVDIDPLLVEMGTIGYAPQHVPHDYAERIIEISNTGVQSTPPRLDLNLHLRIRGNVRYWSISTLAGASDEICVGQWDTANQTCRGTLPVDVYDPDAGIWPMAVHGLELPVRVIPATDGFKEWSITFYVDDPFSPQVTARVTATGLSPPPVTVECPGPITVDAQTPVPVTPRITLGTATSCAWTTGLRPNASNGGFSSTTNCGGSVYFADVPGVHTVNFAARDAQGVMSQCSVEITALRTPVKAVCPPAMTVEFNTTVTLPTSVTSATTPVCAWAIGSRPRESMGDFSAPTSCASTTYHADEPGLHVVDFQATDVVGTISRCSTEITVKKPPVTVTCPASMAVDVQTTAMLPTSVMAASTASCAWSVGSRPPGSTGMFSAPTSCTETGYFADLPGTHQVTFEATDTRGTSNQCTVEITARRTPVDASCPAAMIVEAGTTVSLPTMVSTATTPTCGWSVASRPTGSTGTFSAPTSCSSTTYRADVPGVHLVAFQVADVVGTIDTCTTEITAKKYPVSTTCPGPFSVDAQTSVTLPTTVTAMNATTCGWTAGARPTGSTGTFSAPTSCTSTQYFADLPGTHTVNFLVTDTAGTTAECVVQITARQTPVTASCPGAMLVDANTTVTLPTTVTSATTPTCAWTVGARPTGSTGTFSAPSSCVTTTYRADKPGVHTVNFQATDVVGTSHSCSTSITVRPYPVNVSCPGPQVIDAQTSVTLPTTVSATGATTCGWSVTSRPAGSTGAFSTPASCGSTNYFADLPGTHIVKFIATDTAGTSGQCSVEITARRTGVTASCPMAMTVDANSTVTLPTTVGSASTPTCAWTVGSRPTGSTGTFSAPASCVSTTYRADKPGVHVVNFQVADVVGTTDSCSTAITVRPYPVTVSCPGPMAIDAQTSVTLPTTVSATGATTCAWSVTSRPAGSTGAFSSPASCGSTNYFADLPGTHIVKFVATDTAGTSGQCSVEITARQTPVNVTCPGAKTVTVGSNVTLPTTVTSATTPTCAWTVSSRPTGSTGTFSAPSSCVTTGYLADKVGVHTVQFEATDVVGTSQQCTVQITATPAVTATCPAAMTVEANTIVPLPTTVVGTSPTCAWTVGSRPPTSSGTFSAPASCVTTNYVADVVGLHTLNFTARDALGSESTCNTPITVTARGGLWVELTWDKNDDVDLHLLHPNAGPNTNAGSWFHFQYDCSYENKNPNWGSANVNPHLDVDDRLGRGPENTRINVPALNLKYTVGAHFFNAITTGAVQPVVKVYCNGTLLTTRTRPLNPQWTMWVVGTVEFKAGGQCEFIAIDRELDIVHDTIAARLLKE